MKVQLEVLQAEKALLERILAGASAAFSANVDRPSSAFVVGAPVKKNKGPLVLKQVLRNENEDLMIQIRVLTAEKAQLERILSGATITFGIDPVKQTLEGENRALKLALVNACDTAIDLEGQLNGEVHHRQKDGFLRQIVDKDMDMTEQAHLMNSICNILNIK